MGGDGVRLTSVSPLLRPLALTPITLLPVVSSVLAVSWNVSSPGAAADVSEVPAEPTGLSVGTEQASLDVPVDWDDVNGATDYPVNRRLRVPRQELNNGVSGAASKNYFPKDSHLLFGKT